MKTLNNPAGDALQIEGLGSERRVSVHGVTSARKPYSSPSLTVYGCLADLTRGVGNDSDDGFAGTVETT